MTEQPTGTVTFLFTDIEGSTRRWQDEPDAMRALLVEHDAILREVIVRHRGHLFKHTGDGVTAAFASASDAVNAAADAAAVLITAAARHYNVGIGGQYPAALACRVHAQAAVDANAGDVTAAQRRGQAMTLDDLITYTLDFLE